MSLKRTHCVRVPLRYVIGIRLVRHDSLCSPGYSQQSKIFPCVIDNGAK